MNPARHLAALAALTALATASLHAQSTLYWGGGTADIADGTPLSNDPATLTGNWTNTTENWSNAFSPTDYQPWADGSFVNLGYYVSTTANAVITVDGNKSISGMFASLTAANNTNRAYDFNAAAAGTTLTLTGTQANFLITGDGTATRGVVLNPSTANLSFGASSTKLVKDGIGKLQLGSSGGIAFNGNAFTGDVLIRGGALNLAASGSSLNGVTKMDIIGYRPSINFANANGNQGFVDPTLNFTLPNSASNVLNDSLEVTLTRGRISINGGGGGGASANETIGSVTFQGMGVINVSSGTAGSVVNIGSLSRGSDGRGTAILQVSGTDGVQSNVRITSPGSIPTDTLLPWFSTSRAEWVRINSSTGNTIERVVATAAATDATTWDTTYGATSNIRVSAALTGALDANTTVNSLGFINGTTLDLGGNTLTLNAGALGFAGVTATINNGTLTTSSVPLYINGGWTNSGGMNLNAVLSGAMDIYYTGQTTLTIGGSAANTYTGTMYIQSGTVRAVKASAITGNVQIGTGAALQIANVTGLAAGANLTMAKDSLLRLDGAAPNISGTLTNNGGVINTDSQSLTLSGSGTGFRFNGGIINSPATVARQLAVLTNVSYDAASETQAVVQSAGNTNFSVHLSAGGAATRTFDIANSTLHTKAEMLIDVPVVNGSGSSPVGSLVKTGDGVLQLTANNTYTGTTTVNGGTLHLARIQASAQSNLVGTFTNNAMDGHILTFVAPITGNMAVGQTVTGTNIATNRVITGILNDYQVILNGDVGTTASTSATNIALGAVDRAGQLASATTVNSGGTLLMDTGTFVNNTVTVNSGGILAGTGTITGATVITGSLRPGHSIGTKTVTNDVTWNSSTSASDAWVFELGTAASTLALANSGSSTQDLLNITGATSDFLKGTTGGSWLFDFAGTGSAGWYKLVDWAGTTTFSVSDFTYTNLASGYSASFVLDTGSGSTEALYLNVIPEPQTWALLAAALGAMVIFRRRRS